ncbi:Alpha/Beta hydrolase protein [Nemania sp. FL0031]|nr:Alpha/Beta hydrolase protein [Nemania sp. FL0031]
MPRLWSIVRQKPARVLARTGLRTSAALPTSGATSLDNSGGASQAAAELLDSLDTALAQLSLEDDPRAQLTARLEQLDWKASIYVNSSLDFCNSKEPWKCAPETANLIMKAWECAEAAYERDVAVLSKNLEGSDLNLEWSLASSTNGNVKATLLTTFVAPPQNAPHAQPTTYLIVAVRGSASTVDQLVNLHGEPRDAGILFQDMGKSPTPVDQTLNFQAHAGFLNSARELLPQVSTQIEKQLSNGHKFNVVFTGHSAGGAVATLLHLALRIKFTGAPFSCITFGSPPVARLAADKDKTTLDRILEHSHVLNIVNEYDLVSRLDKDYVRSIIRLFNSEAPSTNGEEPHTTEEKGDSDRIWPLPIPELQHIGSIVVLKTELPNLQLDSMRPSELSTRVTAWSVTSGSMSELVFCKLQVHKRKYYREKIEQLVCDNSSNINPASQLLNTETTEISR